MTSIHEVAGLGARLFAVPCAVMIVPDEDGVVVELFNIHKETLNVIAKGGDYDGAMEAMKLKLVSMYHEGIRVVKSTKDALKADEALRAMGLPGVGR